MKRFILFTYSDYHAMGGMNDFQASYDSIQEIIDYLSNLSRPTGIYQPIDCANVLDTEDGEIMDMTRHIKYV
jgi:ethanolamine utilization cobalamin adenosyltransferase